MEKLRIILQLFADPGKIEFTDVMDGDEAIFVSEKPSEEDTLDTSEDDNTEDGVDDPQDDDPEVEPDPIFFPRLRVVDKNLQHTQVGTLLVADEEGNLLTVEADEDGAVREQNVLIEDNNILDGSISGEKLQESTITSREIDMNEIFSDSELIKQLMAMNIDAAALFDNEGFMERYDERYWQTYIGQALEATDLNEVAEPGRYYSGEAAGASAVANKPKDVTGFVLDVLRTGETALQQIFRAGKEAYVRSGTDTGEVAWEAWNRQLLSPINLANENADVNTFTFANGYTDGVWKSHTDGGAANISNIPEKRAFEMELWCPRHSSTTDYIMRMRIMYAYNKTIHERWCVNGTWTAWELNSTEGVPAKASKLQPGCTIAISGGATGTATSFDGSVNITIPVTALDVSKATAGTLTIARGGTEATDAATARSKLGVPPTSHASTATTYGVSTTTNYGHAMASSETPLVAGTAAPGSNNGKFAREGHVHPAQTTITGNAGSATKLATPRKIGNVDFDGSAPITLAQIGAAGTAPATSGAAGLMSAGDKSKLDGIASSANNYSHPNSGVTAGTYHSVTVNAQGHVTGGGNATVQIEQGGTGATKKSDALKNLGITYSSSQPTYVEGTIWLKPL